MSTPEKIFVSIYCEVKDNSFSDEMRNTLATGDEIFEFLMKDSQICLDKNGEPMSGDCNLWYLGCNNGFGQIRYNQKEWLWKSGESSFDIVSDFLSNLYNDNVINREQFEKLMDKIDEGRFIGDMVDIKNFLLARKEGRPFVPLKQIIEDNMEVKRRTNHS